MCVCVYSCNNTNPCPDYDNVTCRLRQSQVHPFILKLTFWTGSNPQTETETSQAVSTNQSTAETRSTHLPVPHLHRHHYQLLSSEQQAARGERTQTGSRRKGISYLFLLTMATFCAGKISTSDAYLWPFSAAILAAVGRWGWGGKLSLTLVIVVAAS